MSGVSGFGYPYLHRKAAAAATLTLARGLSRGRVSATVMSGIVHLPSHVITGGHSNTKYDNQVNILRVNLMSDWVGRPCPDQAGSTSGARGTAVGPEEEPRMSIKTKVLAAAATLTLVGGLGAAGALSANAATPSCGHNCIDIFSRTFGTHHRPNFVLDVFRGISKTGTPIILYRTSNSDAAEDFTISFQGTVTDFFNAGLVSAALNLHYGSDWAYEIEYSPYGRNSGLCVGVGSTAANLTPVSLQPCGASAKTVWVVDSAQHDQGLLRPADQRLGHQLLAPVRPALPGQLLPDGRAAPAAQHLYAADVLQRDRVRQRDVGR